MADRNGDGFRIGRTLSLAWGVFIGNFLTFNGLALAVLVPTLVLQLAYPEIVLGDLDGEVSEGSPWLYVLYWCLSFVLYVLVWASVIYGTKENLAGRSVPALGMVSQGFVVLGPALAMSFVWTVAFVAGLIVLIVPGVWVMVVFWVALPALVVEQPGVIASFRRSSALTKGVRWRLLGLFAVVIAISIVVMAPLQLLLQGMALMQATGFPSLLFIVSYAVGTLATVYFSILIAVSYHELRRVKEGGDSADVAAVFD